MEQELSQIEKYIKEIEQDLRVDAFNIKDVQMKLPALKHKWVGRLIRHKSTVSQLQKKKDKLKKTAAEQLKKTSPYQVSTTVLEKAVEKHDILTEINDQISDNLLIIELLEKTEKVFSSFTYDLKNLVEIMKMENL